MNDNGSLLLNLLGGVALLLWATRLVKTGVLRAFGDVLKGWLNRATANRWAGAAFGAAVATALQSSTATALLLVSFTTRGLIALPPALAVLLGADLGSTLVVQVMSFDLKTFIPLLLVIGVGAFMLAKDATIRQVGRILIGLSLMVMSLGMIVAASSGLRGNPTLVFVLSRLGDEPVFAVLIAAMLTWLMHSSVAFVLLIIALAEAQVVGIGLAIALLIGANIGGGLIPLGLGWREPQAGRRLLIGNLGFRLFGALVALLMLPVITQQVIALGFAPGKIVAFAHMGFNLALLILFLPFVDTISGLLHRFVPDDPARDAGTSRPLHLDESLLDKPQLALGAAAREVMRVAERVEAMLSDTIHTFVDANDERRMAIRKLDDEVDALQEAIKLYLTRLTRQPLSEEDARRAFDLILFTTNLEHVGDIIDKNLLELAAKRQRYALTFSEAGWAELTDFHARIVRQMKLAMAVFMTKDVTMARELMAEKDNIRIAEKIATEQHLARLREGTTASIETSALHLDMLRDLKRINAHIVSVAHPILEASGEMRQSRLRKQPG